MGELGVGVFQLVEDPPDESERTARDARLIELAVESGIPVAIGATGSNTRSLELIDATAAAGGRMFGLTHCRGIGTMSSFKTQLPFDSLPEWKEVRALPADELRHALRDPEVRSRLVWAAHNGPYGRAIGGEARKPDFERMQVLARPLPPHVTVAEMARARGVDPVELMIDLALETGFEQFFVQTNSPFDANGVKHVMKHPRTVMAFSDAGAHVSQMSDCSIQTHFLAHWVRDRQDFTLEEAVRMLTLAPARAWGFHDRGLVREGFAADLNVFDAARVAPAMPTVVNDLPAGARRIKQTAVGFLATIVGGEVVHANGAHTGALPGMLIRGPLARSERGPRQSIEKGAR
jgi:N-acyl-D-aspartate/D-glutamate deacylase